MRPYRWQLVVAGLWVAGCAIANSEAQGRGGQEFRRRGLFSVQDLTAPTDLWEQSALLQSTEIAQL